MMSEEVCQWALLSREHTSVTRARHDARSSAAARVAKAAATKIAERDASGLDRGLMVLPNLPLWIGWMRKWIRVLGRRKVGEEAGRLLCLRPCLLVEISGRSNDGILFCLL